MAGDEDWRKTADTHKMSPEEVRRAGVEASKRPPGHNPGGVLHQRRRLPFSATTMAITGAIGYFTLYVKKKPEASARDVAKVASNTADPDDTRPRKYHPDDPRPRKSIADPEDTRPTPPSPRK